MIAGLFCCFFKPSKYNGNKMIEPEKVYLHCDKTGKLVLEVVDKKGT
jgi:hypothetical protein